MRKLRIGDKVKPAKTDYWDGDFDRPEPPYTIWKIEKDGNDEFIYWNPKADSNCYPNDLILIEKEWD